MADEEVDASRKISLISLSSNGKTKIQRALQTKETKERFCCGYLLGKILENELKVYDLVELDLSLFENVDSENPMSDTVVTEFACIRASFPVGIDIVGVFITQPENGNLEVANHLLNILKGLEDIAYASVFAVCLVKPSTSVWFISYDYNVMVPIEDVVTCNDDLSREVLFRIQQDVIIKWLTSTGKEGLRNEIDRLDSDFMRHKLAFLIEPISTILYEDDLGQTIPDVHCCDFISDLKTTLGVKTWPEMKEGGNVIDVKGLVRISSQSASVVDITEDSTLDEEADNQPLCNVPVLWSQTVNGESCILKLSVDALVAASSQVSSNKLLYLFRDAVYRQCNALSLSITASKNKFLYQPFHFQPSGTNYPVTALLPHVEFSGVEVTEESYLDLRRRLHHRFLLPDDRPLLRKSLACFSSRDSSLYHLVNPHVGLNVPDVGDGKLALVYGKYSYHHYMQDSFDDDKWGCAYRSLQTVSSWLWHQGYTERKYPSHREIQEALVAIGDKENHFVGSKEWIGSMEVSFCLDYFYGVTSKTLHVSSGAELAYKGREIYQHFVDEGTPIMIGGGVLAHTIVGVIFNEQTSAIRYLIVDPHFTGHDNLKTIQSKGWVGWKGPDFWDQVAHYNLCMPQRPTLL